MDLGITLGVRSIDVDIKEYRDIGIKKLDLKIFTEKPLGRYVFFFLKSVKEKLKWKTI